jgi:hypothetical protein
MPKFLKIKLVGKWGLAKNAIATLPESIQRSYRAGQEKYAKKLVKTVKDHIKNQDLNWQPLAESTKKRKGHDTILIDTKAYIESVQIYTQNKSVQVGVKRGLVNPKSGIEISRYASLNEYGSDKKPARPVWEPSIKELGGQKAIAIEVKKLILIAAEKKGFKISIK